MTREHTLTILLAAVLTILVWLWAEGENRSSETIRATVRSVGESASSNFVVRLVDPDGSGELLDQLTVQVELEGPSLGLRRISDVGFEIPLDSLQDGEQRTIQLAEALSEMTAFVELGLSVVATTPARVTAVVDELETRIVPVSGVVPGVVVEQMTIQPDRAEVTMPKAMWSFVTARYGDRILTLDLDPGRIASLQPGEPFSQTGVRLDLIPELRDDALITFDSGPVDVALTVQQNLLEREESIPVRIALPPRDAASYRVTIDLSHELIPDVIVSGDAQTMARFETREIKVFGLINLSSDELEQGVSRKRIEWALPLGLQARMKDGGLPPEIPIQIERLGGEDV